VPNIKSAEKRLRQSEKRRLRNRAVRSELRSRTRKLLETESAAEARGKLRELFTLLDRAAQRNILHARTAARRKARLARFVNKLTN